MTHEALIIDPTSPARSGLRTITADLAGLQDLVGGPIEAVYGYRSPDGRTDNHTPRMAFYVNEEGKIHNLPENGAATALWWHYNRDAISTDILVGPVVILGGIDHNGHDTSVPSDVADVYDDIVTGRYYTGFPLFGPARLEPMPR